MKFIGIVIFIMYVTIKVMANDSEPDRSKNDVYCLPNYAPVNVNLDKGRDQI